jgi:hypothetical protein
MQKPQTQQMNKANSSSQPFNDLLKSLLAVLDKLFKDNPAVVILCIFILLICCYTFFRTININYTYSLVATSLPGASARILGVRIRPTLQQLTSK